MKRRSYKTIPELREPENLIQAYRAVQILQQRVNHLAGEFLIPAEGISTKLVIYSAYVLIKYGKGDKDSVANIVISYDNVCRGRFGNVEWHFVHGRGSSVLWS